MSPSTTPNARFQMRMRGCETVNAQPPRGAGLRVTIWSTRRISPALTAETKAAATTGMRR